MQSDAAPTYSLVLRPYIEEPTPIILPSSHINVNHCPKFWHDFMLSKQESVDAYWETLGYCHLTAGFAKPSSTFPGYSVPEVCHHCCMLFHCYLVIMTSCYRVYLLLSFYYHFSFLIL